MDGTAALIDRSMSFTMTGSFAGLVTVIISGTMAMGVFRMTMLDISKLAACCHLPTPHHARNQQATLAGAVWVAVSADLAALARGTQKTLRRLSGRRKVAAGQHQTWTMGHPGARASAPPWMKI